MQFQVMASVVSAGNHSFAVDYYSKYKKALPLATASITRIFEPGDKTSNPQCCVKNTHPKDARAYAFFALQ